MKNRIFVAIILTVTMTAALAGSASAAPLPVTEPFDGTPGDDISHPANGSGWTWIGGAIHYNSTLVDAGNSGYVAGAPAGGYDYRKYFASPYTLAPLERVELTAVARMPTAGTGWPENLGIEILSPTSVGEPGSGPTGEYMQISFDRDAAASPSYSTYSYIGLWDSPGSPWSSLTTPITSGDTLTMKITTDAHKTLIQYDAGSGWVTVDDQNFGYGTISGVKLFGDQTLGFYDSVNLEVVTIPEPEPRIWEPFDGTPGVDITWSGWTQNSGTIHYDSTLVDAGNSAIVAGMPAGGYDYRKYFATDYTLAPGESAELTVVARMPTAGTGWTENLGIEILSPGSVGEPGSGPTGEYMQISFDRDAAASPNYSTYSYIGLWDSPGSPWNDEITPITSGDTLTMKITTSANKTLIQYDAGSGWVTVDNQAFGYGTISGVKLWGNQTLGFYDSVLLEILPALPGDTDFDGDVDDTDAATLASFWQQAVTQGDVSQGDFNNDGFANDLDAAILAANWTGSAAASVPEPSTLVLLIVGALALLCVKPRRS